MPKLAESKGVRPGTQSCLFGIPVQVYILYRILEIKDLTAKKRKKPDGYVMKLIRFDNSATITLIEGHV